MLRGAARKVATSGAVTSTGESDGFDAANSIGFAGFEDDTSVVVIFDIFVEGDSDAAESVDDLNERAPVEMSVVLEIDAKDVADFGHEGFGTGLFVVVFHIVAPVDFVDFAGGGAGGGGFEIARKGKHGDVAGVLVETNHHNGISKCGAVVDAVAFFAFHVVTASAEGEDIGAAVFVGFEWFVGGFGEGDEVENVALAAGDFGDDVVAPENEPGNTTD